MRRSANLSADGIYRYSLIRHWGAGARLLLFVMLNPSTATDIEDDPTVRLCVEWAKRLGFDGVCVVNLFAYRATDPKELVRQRRRGVDIVGRENDAAIKECASGAAMVLCAWGSNASHKTLAGRPMDVLAMLRKLGIAPYCLKMTKAKQPVHPLYQPYSLQPAVMA